MRPQSLVSLGGNDDPYSGIDEKKLPLRLITVNANGEGSRFTLYDNLRTISLILPSLTGFDDDDN